MILSLLLRCNIAFLNFSFALPAEDPVCVCLPDASYLWHRAGELGGGTGGEIQRCVPMQPPFPAKKPSKIIKIKTSGKKPNSFHPPLDRMKCAPFKELKGSLVLSTLTF